MAQTFAHRPRRAPDISREATLADMGRALKARWRYIVVPTVLAFAASCVFVTVVQPRYTGQSQVLIQAGDNFYTRPGQDRVDQTQLVDEQAVASQVQIIMSRDLAREAIGRLGLVGNQEFDKAVGEFGMLQRVGVMLGLIKDPRSRPPEERVIDEYYEHLLVYPVGKSRVVSVEFRSRDPELAAKGANVISELYLGLQEDVKKDLARSASTWLGSNIDDLRKRVADAEAKVEAFRSKTGLLSGSGTTTLSAQQLSDLSAQLAQARTNQSDAQARAQLIRDLIKDGRGFEIPDVANNELIRRLIEQRINLKAQLALELRTLLPQHPRIKELNAQLADLDSQVRGAAERTARTLENDARITGSRVQSLEAAIDTQKKVVSGGNESEVQLRALEREARVQRDQLEAYLSRYREATARDSVNASPPDARIVSRAVVPQIPSFPKKIPIIALSTLAMLMISAGAIVARELLTGAPSLPPAPLDDEDDETGPFGDRRRQPFFGHGIRLSGPGMTSANAYLEERGPVAAELPPAPAEPVKAPVPDPRYDFGQLVSRLKEVAVSDRARRALVTGAERHPDVAQVAQGLALTFALTGRTIVLEMDPDEAVARHDQGLTDLIAGEASFSDVIGRVPGTKLDRIGIGTLRNEAFTVEPESFDVVLSALDKTYDWIVCLLAGGLDEKFLAILGSRVDVVVIASNLAPANQDLVRVYESAKAAGVKDVLVAREQALPPADSEAA